jgi:hypothetical protein
MPKVPFLALLASASAALLPCPIHAQVSHQVAQITGDLVIDGALDEAAWKSADTLPLLTNNGPGGLKPKTATTVRVLWNPTYLYVSFQVETPRIDGTITQHDGELYTQDVVELFLDPDGDSQNYLELEWNCLNTSLDFRYAKVRQGMDMSWAVPNSKSAVKLRGTANKSTDVDTGLTYEIALAWADVKAWSKAAIPPKPGDNLPVNFYRIDYPPGGGAEELMAWSPTGAADFHRPDKFGKLIFGGPAVGIVPKAGRAWHAESRLRSAGGNGPVPVLTADGKVTWALPGARLAPGWKAFPFPGDQAGRMRRGPRVSAK